jgi:hypothetical protein
VKRLGDDDNFPSTCCAAICSNKRETISLKKTIGYYERLIVHSKEIQEVSVKAFITLVPEGRHLQDERPFVIKSCELKKRAKLVVHFAERIEGFHLCFLTQFFRLEFFNCAQSVTASEVRYCHNHRTIVSPNCCLFSNTHTTEMTTNVRLSRALCKFFCPNVLLSSYAG